MAWIESHEDIGTHPKTYDLMTALNVELSTAVGVLHLLWHFTMKFAWRDGDLSKFSNTSIVRALGMQKDPDEVIGALQNTGWLDDKKVHDWIDYAGKIVRDRIYNENRKTPLNAVTDRKTPATNPTVPTLPNQPKKEQRRVFTKPTAEEVTTYAKSIKYELDGQSFCDFYESKGWLIGKNQMRDWKAAVRTWQRGDRNNGKSKQRNAGQGFKKGDNTAGTVDSSKYDRAGLPD